ncbi:hypothetical protein E2C01_049949 [Portunus trituberculatus]|uniref:Uncharacterized protein n=1 Tax=Portunus trituberculatus TaxID=210409 RepID=A0A5B7G6Y6_PORTR|nr:hypothetical protein [Portunus trituberculatus]
MQTDYLLSKPSYGKKYPVMSENHPYCFSVISDVKIAKCHQRYFEQARVSRQPYLGARLRPDADESLLEIFL